ncbi:dUTP diphosphatase [candidate division WOR-3 bacterium]|nr:dUTP diphosphatase [candidate division WOR-3 bacterium]
MKSQRVRVRLLAGGNLPARQTPGSSGFDLAAAEECVVGPGSWRVVRTGIALELPDGLEAQVRARSGLAARHGVGVLNGPGTVDSDYRGEVKVVLFNLGRDPFDVQPGDRIAQLVFASLTPVELEPCDELSSTGRASGGFGHTG